MEERCVWGVCGSVGWYQEGLGGRKVCVGCVWVGRLVPGRSRWKKGVCGVCVGW